MARGGARGVAMGRVDEGGRRVVAVCDRALGTEYDFGIGAVFSSATVSDITYRRSKR